MAVRPIGGYDPTTGWPPDESTGVPWQDDTALPGQFRGGGAGFGPGGFQGSPRLTGPAAGPPPGISLSNGGGGGASVPPEVIPPQNPTIPTNKSAVPFSGWNAPEAAWNVGKRVLPKILRKRIPGADFVVPPDELAPPAMDEAPPWSFTPGATRPVPRPWGEPSPSSAPDAAPLPRTPTLSESPIRGPIPATLPDGSPAPNFVRPEGEVPRTYPSWPTPPVPAAGPTPMSSPHMPWPDTGAHPGIGSPAPAVPPRRTTPRAAGPAAHRQQPDLGHYGPFVGINRPNADVAGGARGRQSVPYTTALDLSRLFQPRQ
jgi:hypothetical protein